MADPWDRPPFPNSGDDDEDITYAAVGRVISQWEHVESELSHLYALFIGKPWKEEAFDGYYEEGKTTKSRIKSVGIVSHSFFQRNPDQTREGNFTALMRCVEGFADRRHEVAHGIVRPIQWYRVALPDLEAPPNSPFQFCVVPPHYQRSWFDENRMPRYVYTSKELIYLESLLRSLLRDVIFFKRDLMP